MSKLVINQKAVTPENAPAIVKLCPFGAISYTNGMLEISSACKMCKLCARKSGGIVEYVEEAKTTERDKSLWRGICVYADCSGDQSDTPRYVRALRQGKKAGKRNQSSRFRDYDRTQP